MVVRAGDVVISLKHPFTEKKGIVVSVKKSYGVPDTCTVSWDDGMVTNVWQSDVKIVIENREPNSENW